MIDFNEKLYIATNVVVTFFCILTKFHVGMK